VSGQRRPPRYLGWKDLATMAVIAAAVLTFAVHVWSQHRAAATAVANLHCPSYDHVEWGYVQGRGNVPMCADSITITVGGKP
jgi:hypothetical protein